jgi:hypothetical protein
VCTSTEEGLALRGTFIINPDGVIKTLEIHSNEIARDVKETVRKLKAAQYTAAHPGQVCPAKWNEGAKTIGSVAGPGWQDLKRHWLCARSSKKGPTEARFVHWGRTRVATRQGGQRQGCALPSGFFKTNIFNSPRTIHHREILT